jgi:hypothetical protein
VEEAPAAELSSAGVARLAIKATPRRTFFIGTLK